MRAWRSLRLGAFNVIFCDTTFSGTCESLSSRLKTFPSAHVAVPLMVKLTSDLITSAPNLKMIHQWGVGLEGVDVEAATRQGIFVCRVPGEVSYNAVSTAEHAIFLALCLLKKVPKVFQAVRAKALGEPTTEALFKKHAHVIGYGNLGAALAQRLKAFGCIVTASKLHPAWPEDEWLDARAQAGTPEATALIQSADLLFLCCVLTLDNVGMVDDIFVSHVKPGVRIINVARGPLLDYDVLYRGLLSGVIGGLAMDVFWTEPFDPQDPLLALDNVIATPHVGGHCDLSVKSIGSVLAANILRIRAGLAPLYAVNAPEPRT